MDTKFFCGFELYLWLETSLYVWPIFALDMLKTQADSVVQRFRETLYQFHKFEVENSSTITLSLWNRKN
jgi:hypothetical protein